MGFVARRMALAVLLVCAACGDESAAPDAGGGRDDGGSSIPVCQVACGACEPALSITLHDDAAGGVRQGWSARIMGKGVDCESTSAFDACASSLRAGKYNVRLFVDGVQVGMRDVVIAATHPPAGACCDCGYIPATLSVHYGAACEGDAGSSDAGSDDAGTHAVTVGLAETRLNQGKRAYLRADP